MTEMVRIQTMVDEIERLRTALRRIRSLEEKNVPKYAQQIAREALSFGVGNGG